MLKILNGTTLDGDSNILRICRYLLQYWDIKHTKTKITQVIINHMEPLSLLAVKDILKTYTVHSDAIKKGNFSYADFETPFVCAIQQEDWQQAAFTVVTLADHEFITYLDPIENKLKKTSLDTFENLDKDIILLFNAEEKEHEENYQFNRKQERVNYFMKIIPIWTFVIAILLVLGVMLRDINQFNWISPLFLITSSIGMLVSFLLTWLEIDAFNPFLKEVCGSFGKKSNCNTVLSSTGASFFGLSWSIWGFAYFITLFISQLFLFTEVNHAIFWTVVSVVASTYIIYSIYYQWRIIKHWCPLCLVVLAVLAVNGIAAIFYLLENAPLLYDFQWTSLIPISFLFVAALLFVYQAIPIIKNSRKTNELEGRWKRLRYNPEVFQALLAKSTPITVPTYELGIVLGNPEAKHEIIKICNPYCPPCARAHPELESIIAQNPDVKLRIIFTATGEDDERTPPVKHLLAIQEKYGQEKLKIALDDWYLNKDIDYKSFAQKYPMDVESLKQDKKIQAMKDWCSRMKIRATPTIYINGFELPESYRIAEIKNFF